MKDQYKTKQQLIEELGVLRKELVKLEKIETKQKKAKEKLWESEEKYRHIFKDSPVGIGITSPDGKVVNANKTMETITGYSVEELKKINLANIHVNPEDRKALLEAINRYGGVVNFSTRLKRKDGTPCDALLNVSRIHLGGEDFFQTICQDITERKSAEEALWEGEEKFRAIADYTADWENWVAPDGRLIWVNPAVERITGYSVEEFLAKHTLPFPLCAEEDQAVVKAQFGRAMLGSRGDDQEFRFVRKDGTKRWGSVSWQPIFSSDGKPLGHRSSIRDITKRKQAEEALRESEDRLRLITENIAEVFWMADVKIQRMFYISLGYERIWGRSRESLYTDPLSFLDAVHGEDRERVIADYELKNTLQPFEHEYRIIRSDGSIRWIWDRGFPVQGETGQVTCYVGIAQDITERKRSEEALRESEARFSAIFHASPVSIAITRLRDGQIMDVNDSWQNVSGFTREEAIGHTPIELNTWVNPGERDRFISKLREQGTVQDFEFQVRYKSGIASDMLMSAELIELADERYVLSLAQNITKRKRAEEALRESEATARVLLDSPVDSIMLVNPDGIILDTNQTFAQRIGRRIDELIGRCVYDFLPPELAKSRRAHVDEIVHFEVPIRFEDEHTGMQLDHSARPIFNAQGKVTKIAIIARDITERKRIEVAFRESEENFKALAENANDGIVIGTGEECYHIYANRRAVEITGYPIEELLKTRLRDLAHPDELPKLTERYKKRLAGIEVAKPYETALLNKDGIKVPIEISPSKTTWQNQLADIVIFRDITERKRAEETLRRKSGEQDLLLNNIQTQIWYLTDKETYGAVNKARAEFFGKKNEEMENKKVCDVLGKDEAEICMSGYVEVFEKRKQIHTEEWITNAKGEKRLLSIIKSPKLNENGDVEYVVCSAEDITERKQAEEMLYETKELYRTVLQTSPDGISINDTEGRITFVSERMLSLYGLIQPGDVIGHSPFEFIAPEDHARARLNIQNVFKNNYTSYNQYTLVKKDGTKFIGEINSSLLRDASGKPRGMISVIRDITERKKAEKERDQLFEQVHASRERLRNLSQCLVEVQEVERHDLVRKLHDEVGQNLTALGINLDIVHSQLPPETVTKTVTRIDDSLKLVEETVERIRDVMAELRPPVLDDYGVSAALHWYGKQFSERMGIITLLQVEELKPRLPLPVEMALFRIAQEALTNVVKHAQAKNVTVRLEEFGESVQLSIADDGIGFDSEAHHQPEAKPEWGLINMRERAQAIDGQLRLETAPGKGTQIVVEVPRNH